MNKWIQGYACAIATLVSSHGENTGERDALSAAGLTSIKALKAAKVDEYDIKILKPLIKELKRERKNK